VASAAALGATMLPARQPIDAISMAHRPVQEANDGYSSSTACRACHPSEYASWRGSFHRTMTQVATPDTARASFDGTTVNLPGTTIHLQQRGSALWATFPDPDAAATTNRASETIDRQIVMITGSHQQQAFWYRTDRGRLLGQLPAMLLIPEGRWIPRQSAFLRPHADSSASETGRWNGVCINCHATHGKWRFASPIPSRLSDASAADTTTAELGIACEACHGPAGDHVRANGNPVRRYRRHLEGGADPTVINPIRLDPIRSSQVCGQCHSVWNYYDRQSEQDTNTTGAPYRPGENLAETRFIAAPPHNTGSPVGQQILARDPNLLTDSFWSDGMIRVSGREYNGLIESPCYRLASDAKKMSCSSCHAMHPSAGDRTIAEWADTHQVARDRDGNGACIQCHAGIGTGISQHTRHQPNSTGSLCYNCHMPYTTYGLLRAMRSHQVSSPTVEASLETGRPNACNLCHLDKTLGWTNDNLERWYKTPKVALGQDEQTIAASLLWLLRGDAGQRAVVAWSAGWAPAQAASGTSWETPFLSGLLDDPYDAVRIIAYRSLRTLPGLGGAAYDFMAPSTQRLTAIGSLLDVWQRTRSASGIRTDGALLFNADGSLKTDVLTRLVRQRDNRRVSLRE
jgi:hypothetical protein